MHDAALFEAIEGEERQHSAVPDCLRERKDVEVNGAGCRQELLVLLKLVSRHQASVSSQLRHDRRFTRQIIFVTLIFRF